MRIYSEKTNKEYKSVEECLKAEKAFDAEVKAKEEKKAKLAETRKTRAMQVEADYADMRKAEKRYAETLNAFIKDYGSYHMTVKDIDEDNYSFHDFLDEILSIL